MARPTEAPLEKPPDHPIVLFQAADGQVCLDVRLEEDTVWLSQAQMSELFGRERSVISRHVRNVFREGELPEPSNVHFLHIAGADRPVGFYSLDVIISVGYRVKSPRGTQFRIWATQVLRQHLIQGYTLHQRRLKERGLGDLQQALGLMARTLNARRLVSDEGGNKRIGTLLFLEFLRRNQLLFLVDGQPRIADNGMAALALLIAESHPQQKDLMIRLVMALLEDHDG